MHLQGFCNVTNFYPKWLQLIPSPVVYDSIHLTYDTLVEQLSKKKCLPFAYSYGYTDSTLSSPVILKYIVRIFCLVLFLKSYLCKGMDK